MTKVYRYSRKCWLDRINRVLAENHNELFLLGGDLLATVPKKPKKIKWGPNDTYECSNCGKQHNEATTCPKKPKKIEGIRARDVAGCKDQNDLNQVLWTRINEIIDYLQNDHK